MSEKKSSTHEPQELTKEQKKTITDWLIEKWGPEGECYVCKTSDWPIGKDLVTPTLFSEKGLWAGGTAYQQVIIVCTNCGHTVHFNAITIGLLESNIEREESSQEVENG